MTNAYSPEVINIQRHETELNIILSKVNNFDIKQKRHGILVLLYATNTKQDLEDKDLQNTGNFGDNTSFFCKN